MAFRHTFVARRRTVNDDNINYDVHDYLLQQYYLHYLVNDYGSRDDYDDNGSSHDYNGGRKGYYNPAVNYDYLYNDDDSGSTASPATAASAANND